jgi:hypothetical protein
MPAPRHRRIIAGAVLGTVLGAVAFAGPADASPTSYCALPNAARAYVVGLVWADGGIANDMAMYKTSSDSRATQIEAAAACANEPVERIRSGTEWRLRFPGLTGAQINQAGLPPMMRYDRSAEYLKTKAFLAGVVESEGGRTSGLVVDDVHPEHVNAIKPMLDRVGIGWHQEGNKLYAERTCWSLFSTFPFNTYRRVPGYEVTWTL